MRKFLTFFILTVVLKSVVSTINLNSNINFLEDQTNKNVGTNGLEEESSRTAIIELIDSVMDSPEIVSAFLEPENLAQIPALLIKFERALMRAIRERILSRLRKQQSQLNLLAGQGKHPLFARRFPQFNRRQKRNIPEMINYFSSFLFSEIKEESSFESSTSGPSSSGSSTSGSSTSGPSTVGPTTQKPTNFESTTIESLEAGQAKVLHPKQEDVSNGVDEMSSLLRIDDEGLKSAIRDAIKTEDGDKRTKMYNFNIPEMKKDVVYVQKLEGSSDDNTVAFLKQLETNEIQNFYSEEYQQEISESTTETEEAVGAVNAEGAVDTEGAVDIEGAVDAIEEIEAIAGIEAIDGIEAVDAVEAIAAMEAVEAVEAVDDVKGAYDDDEEEDEEDDA